MPDQSLSLPHSSVEFHAPNPRTVLRNRGARYARCPLHRRPLPLIIRQFESARVLDLIPVSCAGYLPPRCVLSLAWVREFWFRPVCCFFFALPACMLAGVGQAFPRLKVSHGRLAQIRRSDQGRASDSPQP